MSWRTGALAGLFLAIGCGRENFDPAHNVAFVTSTAHDPTTLRADLSGADEICEARAADAGLVGPFVAHLDRPSVPATDRLANARGWLRTDARPLADRDVDLEAGRLLHPLRLDEHGEDVGTQNVFVAFGGRDGNGAHHTCEDYTAAIGFLFGSYADATGWNWRQFGSQPCTAAVRLACFGIGFATPLEPVEIYDRRAFITVQTYASGAGLAGADLLCAQEAELAGLPGTYLALLTSTSATAASRFDLTGPTWARVDGGQLASSPLQLMAGELMAPLNLTATGELTTTTRVMTGGLPGGLSLACGDWTDPVANTPNGDPNRSGPTAFSVLSMGSCAGRLYCLQE